MHTLLGQPINRHVALNLNSHTHPQAVNTELKELQRARPDMWEAETSYYGGVVRRTVNPFHVIELIPLLKVRFWGQFLP